MSTVPATQKVWKLVKYVEGELTPDNFKLVEEKVDRDLKDGEFLVRTVYLSVDPTLVNWANEHPPYTPQIPLGDTFNGYGLAEVIESNDSSFSAGQLLIGATKFQEYAKLKKSDVWAVVPKIDPKFPLHVSLSVLGLTAWTAYVGIIDLAKPKDGDTVLVSGALGAVGLIVSHIAKIKGLRVVGIAGSEEKCKKYVSLGFDGCVNYKDPKWADQLKVLCPKGVDIYFDNVGGEISNIVLLHLNNFARFILCGAISQYQNKNDQPTYGLPNYLQLLFKSAELKGLFVFHHTHRFAAATQDLSTWLHEGKLPIPPVTITKGIETSIAQIQALYTGGNEGKSLVQLAPLPSPYHN